MNTVDLITKKRNGEALSPEEIKYLVDGYTAGALNGCNLTASITAIANTLACRLTEDELTLLGSVLTQLGDTLLTLATHRSICNTDIQ